MGMFKKHIGLWVGVAATIILLVTAMGVMSVPTVRTVEKVEDIIAQESEDNSEESVANSDEEAKENE